MSRGSLRTSTMSALSIATSVPAPIAIPTSAGGERRRVVHAVAHHRGHEPSRSRTSRHLRGLVGRAAPRRSTRRCPSSPRDPRGDAPVVAGEHQRADARVACSVVDRLARLGPDDVGERDRRRRARRPTSTKTTVLPCRASRSTRLGVGLGDPVLARGSRGWPRSRAGPRRRPRRPRRGARGSPRPAAAAGTAEAIAARDRVLGVRLDRGGERRTSSRSALVEDEHVGDAEAALGERAGLVEDDGARPRARPRTRCGCA